MEKITELWPIALSIALLIIWSIRLEGKVIQNERDCSRIEGNLKGLNNSHVELEKGVLEQLSRIRESLAKLEGLMQSKKQSFD